MTIVWKQLLLFLMLLGSFSNNNNQQRKSQFLVHQRMLSGEKCVGCGVCGKVVASLIVAYRQHRGKAAEHVIKICMCVCLGIRRKIYIRLFEQKDFLRLFTKNTYTHNRCRICLPACLPNN